MHDTLRRWTAHRAAWAAALGIAGALVAGGCQILSGLNDLEEGPPTGTSTGMGGGSSSASTSATMCGTGGMNPCTNACLETCNGGMPCTIDCPGSPSCSMGSNMIACDMGPGPAMDCTFACNASTSASTGTGMPAGCSHRDVICPKNGTCRVVCSGMGACQDTDIQCGDGVCIVECILGGCEPGTRVHCGTNRCEVGCPLQMTMMMGSMPPTVDDTLSCSVKLPTECG